MSRPTSVEVPTPDPQDPQAPQGARSVLDFLARALKDLATLSDAMAADVAPLVRAADTGPERERAMRGLQNQDALSQHLHALSAAAAATCEDPNADLREILPLDALIALLDAHGAPPPSLDRPRHEGEDSVELF